MLEQTVMTPREIVEYLDRFIVGQPEAKRKVAIALRQRWCRSQVQPESLREEIVPKNILMIGPTGVGKTEIARRMAKLVKAPFIKVEATKYTEIGYVGRDVESIIRDLADIAFKMEREEAARRVEIKAAEAAEERILDALLPAPTKSMMSDETPEDTAPSLTRQKFRRMLRDHELDDKEIELHLTAAHVGVEIMAPPGLEEMSNQLSTMFQSLNEGKKRKRKLKVRDALKSLQEEEAAKLIDQEDLKARAIKNVEENGIVFIDEFDKIVERQDVRSSGGVSREGVQRDLLPLIEGCSVNTKYGTVKTDHILFIASGAFHLAKPSDLVPELQGRLPIRVELKPLSTEDFIKILTEPKASLINQYTALLATENVTLHFQADAVRRLAEIAYNVNEKQENIGARRLHTVVERLLEEISFTAADQKNAEVSIDAHYVNQALEALADDEDLSKVYFMIETQKIQAAQSALAYIQRDMIVGVGTGSTVNAFIDALAERKNDIEGAVASSKQTAERLKARGIRLIDPNSVDQLSLYIDGADEINALGQMIKGGGGAHTGEKILANLATQFICIADESKWVTALGAHAVALEVLPMARSFVARHIVKLNADPAYRIGFLTDHQNVILDVTGLELTDALKIEYQLNQIPGVVDNGIFAARRADILLLATKQGVVTHNFKR